MSELLAHEDALGSEVNIGNIVHFMFPNAQMIYFIPAQPKYVVVVNSGSTEEDKSCEYRIIEDISAKNLSFFANDISEDIESYPSQSNNEQAFNKVYSHTELCLCDAEGRKIVLGKIESPPLAIKCNNIIGGASFVVSYQKKKNLHGDADEGASETCRIIYDVFNGGGIDYVEVVIRKPKEDSQSYDKQRVYRFYFDGRIEEIKEVLLMYSGGKDSVACIAKLIKEGYRVHLINFDNGCMQFTGLETELALKLELRYGKHKVYWGGGIA